MNISKNIVNNICKNNINNNKISNYFPYNIYYNFISIPISEINNNNLFNIIGNKISDRLENRKQISISITEDILKLFYYKNKILYNKTKFLFNSVIYNDFRNLLIYIIRSVVFFNKDNRFNISCPIKEYIKNIEIFDISYIKYKDIFEPYTDLPNKIYNIIEYIIEEIKSGNIPFIICNSYNCLSIRHGTDDIQDILYRLGIDINLNTEINAFKFFNLNEKIYNKCKYILDKIMLGNIEKISNNIRILDINCPNFINDKLFVHSAILNRNSFIVNEYETTTINAPSFYINPKYIIDKENSDNIIKNVKLMIISFIIEEYFKEKNKYNKFGTYIDKYNNIIIYNTDKNSKNKYFVLVKSKVNNFYNLIHIIDENKNNANDIIIMNNLNNKSISNIKYISDNNNIIIKNSIKDIDPSIDVSKTEQKYFTLPIW